MTVRTSTAILTLALCGVSILTACAGTTAQASEGLTEPETTDSAEPADAPEGEPEPVDETDDRDACPYGTISPGDAWNLMQSDRADITIIDIRRPHEYEEEHVPGAIHIGIMEDDFLEQLRELPRNDVYLIICWHGNTSKGTVYNMKNDGFTSACSVDGGYREWRAMDLPLEN